MRFDEFLNRFESELPALVAFSQSDELNIRSLRSPSRLWKRYLIGNPLFLWWVVKQRLDL